jgi:hypothetical protein
MNATRNSSKHKVLDMLDCQEVQIATEYLELMNKLAVLHDQLLCE